MKNIYLNIFNLSKLSLGNSYIIAILLTIALSFSGRVGASKNTSSFSNTSSTATEIDSSFSNAIQLRSFTSVNSSSPPTMGPGGVLNGLALWVKADQGLSTYVPGATISQWDDLSTRGNHLSQSSDGDRPTFVQVTPKTNFYPALDFDDQMLLNPSEIVSPINGITTFSVATTHVVSGSWRTLIGLGDRYDSPGLHLRVDDIEPYREFGNGVAAFNGQVQTNIPMIWTQRAPNDGALLNQNSFRVGFQGEERGTILEINSIYPIGAGASGIGIGNNDSFFSEDWDGLHMEHIVYDRELTIHEYQRINSYMALKYGVSLRTIDNDPSIVEGDYIKSDGTKIWDYTANTAYHNDVFGIGREDIQGLNQKQSKSSNGDGIITIGLNAISIDNASNANVFTDNEAFLLIGNNDEKPNWNRAIAPVGYEIIDREWYVQETGETGNITFQVNVDNPNFDIPTPPLGTEYYLFFDTNNDNSFTDETATILVNNSGSIWETTGAIDISNGTKFSIGARRVIGVCELVTSGIPDGDGDGLRDECDLDSDNDGILNSDEGACSESLMFSFDSSNEGWTNYSNSNNPLGHSTDADIDECPVSSYDSPPSGHFVAAIDKALGQTAGFQSPDNLNYVFSVNAIYALSFWLLDDSADGGASQISGTRDVTLSGDGISITTQFSGDINTGWQLISIPITNANWSGSQADIDRVLGDLDRIQIEMENISNSIWPPLNCTTHEYMAIDEVQIECIPRDTDNDGTPNYLDLDSDDDGCPDAVEGSGFFSLTELDASGRLIGSSGSDGLPLIAGSGQDIGVSQDATVNNLCSINDLDQDNDGISNVDEGYCDTEYLRYSFDSGVEGWRTDNNNSGFSYGNLDNSGNGSFAGCNISSVPSGPSGNYVGSIDQNVGSTYFESPDNLSLSIPFSDLLEISFYWINEAFNGNGTDYNGREVVLRGGGRTISTTYNGDINTGWQFTSIPLNNASWSGSQADLIAVLNDLDRIEIGIENIWTRHSGSCNAREYFALDELVIRCTSLDTDGDNTPDYLDLDSDDDGCFDALEGSGSLVDTDLDSSGEIQGIQDGNGVPILASGGQAIGSSRDDNILNCCTDASAVIDPHGQFDCSQGSLQLFGQTSIGAIGYQWSTLDGAFSGNTDIANPIISSIGTYTLTVESATGCFSSISTTVTKISDNSAPVFVQNPTDLYLECDPATNSAAINAWIDSNGGAIATDNCGQVYWNHLRASAFNDCDNNVFGTVTFIAIDSDGNTAEADAIIYIEDTTAPVFLTVPADVTIECDDALPTDMATAAENCGLFMVTFSDSETLHVCEYYKIITRTFIAEDECGNARTATQTIRANLCQHIDGVATTNSGSQLGSDESIVNNVSCFNGSDGKAYVTATNGSPSYSYLWDNGQATDTLFNVVAGKYYVTITDSHSCTTLDSVTITEPAAALSSLETVVSNVSCFGGTDGKGYITASNGTSGYSYEWDNGQLTDTLFNVIAGEYFVTITDTNNCTAIDSITISEPADAITSVETVVNNVSCYGGTDGKGYITASNGTPGYSYEWDNGQLTDTLFNVIAGEYFVTITDTNNCTAIDSITITEPAAAITSVETVVNNVSCFGGSDGKGYITASNGTSGYTYAWNNGQLTDTLFNVIAGEYFVTITDANNCTTLDSITISQPATAITSVETVANNVSCFGSSDGKGYITASNGTSGYTYAWDNGQLTDTLFNVIAGEYFVTITDTNNCTAIDSITISEPAAAITSVETVVNNVSCFGGSDGKGYITASNGTSGYTYAWDNGQLTDTLFNVIAGEYFVTITDANNCTALDSITIGQPADAITSVETVVNNVSCFGGSDGKGYITASNGTSGYTYAWDNGQLTDTLFNVIAGEYFVTITDANNCTTLDSITITEPAAAITSVETVVNNVSCFGGSDGKGYITASNGTSGYTYEWDNGQLTDTLFNVIAGEYFVTITDTNNCTAIDSITISEPADAITSVETVVNNVSCYGGTDGKGYITASNGTPGYSYEWDNGQLTDTLFNVIAGEYFVTITDTNNCTAIDSITITEPAAAITSVETVVNNVSCFGGSDGKGYITASNGTSGYTYAWNNGQLTDTLFNVIAGEYFVTITDANNCTTLDSITISQPAAAITSVETVANNVSCFGSSDGKGYITASNGTSGYTYAWDNGQLTDTLFNVIAGEYFVTITDTNNCTAIDSITISEPAAAITSVETVVNNVSCFGGSDGKGYITASNGTSGYTYAWDNGQLTDTLFNVIAGEYFVTITDANNCTALDSITIGQPADAITSVETVVNNVSCFGGSDGKGYITASNGTSGYTYAWDNGQLTDTLFNVIAGEYFVTITDTNNCTAIDSITISEPAAAITSVETVANNVSCFGGSDGKGFITASNGTSGYTYEWDNGQMTDTLFNVIAGEYFVTITDANNCTAIDSITISQPAAAITSVETVANNVSCFGGSDGKGFITASNGTSGYTYEWDNGQMTDTLFNVIAGEYFVTITDANNCTAIDSITISQPAAAITSVETVANNVSCFGGSDGKGYITASNGTSGYTYEWDNGQMTDTLFNVIAGEYFVTITDANNCTALDSVTISEPAASITSVETVVTNVSCFGGSDGKGYITASNGTSGYTYAWNNGQLTDTLFNVIAGQYFVTITDANNCTALDSITISQPAAAITSIETVVNNVSCFGGSDGKGFITASNGTSGYAYAWDNGQLTDTLFNVIAGEYFVTITDANNCTTLDSITISQPAAAITSIETVVNNVSCFGGSDGKGYIIASNGTSGYTYAWGNGQLTDTLFNVIAGEYFVTITDANNCTALDSVTISEPAASITSVETVVTNVSCFGGSDGKGYITASNGTSGYTYAWNNGQLTDTLFNVIAGQYFVTITDANNCTALDSITISQPAAAITSVETVVNNVSCFGGSDGKGYITASNGTSGYTYAWDNGQMTDTLFNVIAGEYFVTITDANNCTALDSITISQPAAAITSVEAVVNNVSCFGGSDGKCYITASNGTSGYTYAWDNGQMTDTLFNVMAGEYFVTITDANNCTTLDSITISQPAAAITSVETVANNVSCFGSSDGKGYITASNGTSGYTYAWDNGQLTDTLFNVKAGEYFVTITDTNNCTAIDSITIIEPAAAITSVETVVNNVSCFGGSDGKGYITASNGTSGYTYEWDNGQMTDTLFNVIAGEYFVTITDANNCTAIDSITISQPAAAITSIETVVNNVSCFGGSDGKGYITASNGTSGYTYEWDNGQMTDTLFNVIAGEYFVTITDANNCTAIDSITISQPAAAITSVETVVNNVSCFGSSDGKGYITASNGTPGYSYEWDNGQMTDTLFNVIAGEYFVTITDANNCTAIDSITISEPAAAITSVETVVNNVSCFGGSDGKGYITASNGTSGYTYAWDNGQLTDTLFNVIAGQYFVTITDENNCTALDSITINQPAAAITSVETVVNNVSCFGGSDGKGYIIASNGTSGYTYAWDNGQMTDTLFNAMAGQYLVTITDANNCTAIDSITISQPAAAITSVETVVNNVSCFGGTDGKGYITASNGTSGYTYEWDNGQMTDTLFNVIAGEYFVTITDANNCTTLDSITISQPAAAITSVETVVNNVSCFGGSDGQGYITASNGTSGYTYAWDNGQLTDTLFNVIAGEYFVTITDANNCTALDSITISQPAAAITSVETVVNNVSCFGGSDGQGYITASNGTSGYTYEWDNGQMTDTLFNVMAGQYFVTITDANNCTAIDSITITEPAAAITSVETVVNNVSCFGGSDGKGYITASNGTSGYTYAWDNGQLTDTLFNVIAGQYFVTITDANNCTALDSITISQPAAAITSVETVVNNVSCFGGSDGKGYITASNGTSGYTYAWDNGQLADTLFNVIAGEYFVTITDANNCTTLDSITISQPAAAITSVETVVNNVSCFGGSDGKGYITASNGTSGYTYEWDNGQMTDTLFNVIAGEYFVTITDANNCTTLDSITITEPAAAITSVETVVNNVSCFGGSDGKGYITASNGTSGYTYAWGNGQLTDTLFNVSADKYYVTITDANNCTALDSITISEPAAAITSVETVVNNVSCFGGSDGKGFVIASNGTPGYSYNWTDGQVTDTIFNVTVGTYYVTITDALLCTTIDSISISVVDTISPTFTVLDSLTVYGSSDCSLDTIAYPSPISNIFDNCNSTILDTSYTDVISQTCLGTFEIQRTWTLSDRYGNASSQVQIISVIDTVSPTFTTPDAITLYLDANCFVDTSTITTGVVTDEYDCFSSGLVATRSDVKVNNCTEGSYIINRTWSLVDDCGNTTSGLQIITVLDTIKPTFTAPIDTTLFVDVNCVVDTTTLSTGVLSNVEDNCSTNPSIFYSDNVISTCEGNYTIERTWSVSDACANTAVHVQVIEVRDTIKPTFDTPASVSAYLDEFNVVDTSTTTIGAITNIVDGCSNNVTVTYRDSVVDIRSAQVLEEVYRIWSVSDDCGNSNSYLQRITVFDTIAPSYTVPLVVQVDCESIPLVDTLDFSDINGIVDVSMVESVIDTPCIDRHTIIRTWTAIDAVGNQSNVDQIYSVSSCNVTVDATVSDSTPCIGEFVTLSGSLNHAISTYTYYPQWFYRSNATAPWTVMTGGSQQTIIFPAYNFRAGEYKLVYSTDNNHSDASECQYESNAFSLSIPIAESAVTNESAAICNGETYSIGDSTFTESGNYNVIFSNQNGCDSIVTLQLEVNEVAGETIEVILCEGEFYEMTSGTRHFETGIYRDTLSSTEFSCDSVVVVNLTIAPKDSVSITESICQGDTVIFNGISLTTSGQYIETFISQFNCDSTVTLDLVVNQPTGHDIDITICEGSSYLFNGIQLTTDTIQDLYLIGASGCDSIVHLNLKVRDEIVVAIYDTTCYQEPYSYGNKVLLQSGVYRDTFPTSSGCDSINELHLYMREQIVNAFEVRICSGDSYVFKNTSYSTSQTVTESLSSSNGCDSLVQMTLVVGTTRSSPSPENHVICSGDSLLVGSNYIKEPGTYNSELVNSLGCLDSSVTYNITVLEPILNEPQDIVICAGDSVYLNGAYRKTSDTYISNLQSSVTGCDSIVATNLLVEDVVQLWSEDINLCLGESFNLFVDGAETLTWTNSDLLSCNNCPNPSGLVDQTTTFTASTMGCAGQQQSVDITVTVFNEVQVEVLTPDTVITLGESIVLDAFVTDPFTQITWFDEVGNVLCTNCSQYEIRPEQSGTYYAEVNSNSGCVVRDAVAIRLRDGCGEGTLNIPNYLSPNADGLNDELRIEYEGIQSVEGMRIYNRWGQLVFETDNAEEEVWKGTFKGLVVNPGVFLYYLNYTCLNGNKKVRLGNVTILR